MKKIIAKIAVLSTASIMALTSFAGCNNPNQNQGSTQTESKEKIVRALNKVLLTENRDVLTSSAEQNDDGSYSVVVITEDSATQYEVSPDLTVEGSTDLVDAPTDSAEAPASSTEAPAASEELPASSAEAPASSEQVPSTSGEDTPSSSMPEVEDTTPAKPQVSVLELIRNNVTEEQYAQIELILTDLGIGDEQLITMLQAVYAETLAIAEINVDEVLSLDYSKTKYFGQEAIEVKVKTAAARYEYTFSTKNYALFESEIKLNAVKQEVTEETVFMTEAEATDLVLAAISADKASVSNFKLKDDTHKNKQVYKIDFTFGGYDYSFKVNAISRQIVKFDKEMSAEQVLSSSVETVKTKEEALASVYAYLNINENDEALKLKKVKLDYEDGAFVYEIKLKLDGKEYEFEVSTETAEITDIDMDYDDDDRVQIGNKHDHDDKDDHDDSNDKDDHDDDHDDDDDDDDIHDKDEEYDYDDHQWKPAQNDKLALSEEQAVEKALAELKVENAFVKDVDIEKKKVNGEFKFFYEVEIMANGEKYEYLVDATTGETTLEVKEKHENKLAISEREALELALNRANFSKKQIKVKKVELTEENGVAYYTVKFSHKGENYLFRVDATTGEVTVNQQ